MTSDLVGWPCCAGGWPWCKGLITRLSFRVCHWEKCSDSKSLPNEHSPHQLCNSHVSSQCSQVLVLPDNTVVICVIMGSSFLDVRNVPAAVNDTSLLCSFPKAASQHTILCFAKFQTVSGYMVCCQEVGNLLRLLAFFAPTWFNYCRPSYTESHIHQYGLSRK